MYFLETGKCCAPDFERSQRFSGINTFRMLSTPDGRISVFSGDLKKKFYRYFTTTSTIRVVPQLFVRTPVLFRQSIRGGMVLSRHRLNTDRCRSR